jgi:hypothetical protein
MKRPGTIDAEDLAGCSSLERSFLLRWAAIGGPPLAREYVFHPSRKWRFDFAIPVIRFAIELEGGAWTEGRHTRGIGFLSDCEKYNAAAALDWRVFRLPTNLVHVRRLKPIADLAVSLLTNADPATPN